MWFIKNNDEILITQGDENAITVNGSSQEVKVKKGENIFSSIKREIMEELNLSVRPIKKINNYTFKKFNLIFIECSCTNPNTIKLNEHLKFLWLKPNELKSIDF